jgi:endo-1,4-beta-xylanase
MLGHTLVWHNQTPSFYWENHDGSPKTREELIETMRQHIETVAGRYAGRIDAWDVVNEIIGEFGEYRNKGWVKAFDGDGYEVVRNAFIFADRYAPDAELYYNDFNAWRPEKVAGIARVVKMLQAEGIRIDGIGIQGHWGLNFPKTEYVEAAIDAYASLGLRVNITELDIDVLPVSKEGQVFGWQGLKDSLYQLEEWEEFLDPYKDGLPDEVEEQQAKRYAEVMAIFYRHRDQIDRVTLWGITDAMSWKNGYPVLRRVNYPLLWKRDYTPHKSLDAVLSIPEWIK